MRRSSMKRTFALLTVAFLILGACADDSDGASTTAGDGGATTTAAPDDGAGTTAAGGEGVSTSETDLGTVLVNAEGFTLYVFTNDTDGESTCYDDCAATWPAVPADTAIGGGLDAAMFGSAPRTDGTEQLTVNGQPLYTYTPDTNPGDTTGQGVGGVWFVVGTDGAMIGGPEAAATGRGDYDYGD
jgi:predicted lipoprotein with Yx(FWY)xxD motif